MSNLFLLLLFKVKTELREVSAEERAVFNDEFNHHIFEMVSSSDSNEKIGGILAICTYSIILKTIRNIFFLFTENTFKFNFNVHVNMC